MTTTPVRVQVPGLNLQQEIGSSIRYTSATCLTHSVATPSQYYLIKQKREANRETLHDPSNHTDKNIQSVYYSVRSLRYSTEVDSPIIGHPFLGLPTTLNRLNLMNFADWSVNLAGAYHELFRSCTHAEDKSSPQGRHKL
ncbi:hypothetical protein OUZ56_007407 [Daphnia magna]|uniref:Uncharacterized protein n=1 Tax=Daphnia magna TaxID=35525 RepID=A0ABR0A9V5_9CRUS|nr:hypothetical protein OUZ56_007407 [Daphnia magna]